jgi:hypothetical protein
MRCLCENPIMIRWLRASGPARVLTDVWGMVVALLVSRAVRERHVGCNHYIWREAYLAQPYHVGAPRLHHVSGLSGVNTLHGLL